MNEVLKVAVDANLGDSILLSGGLDTSIIAGLARQSRKVRAYTVVLNGAPAPDLPFAKLIADKFALPHTVIRFETSQIGESLKHVIETLRTFDPMEVRNSLTVFIGLRGASADGCTAVMTGDGADELFAGYSFVYQLSTEKIRESLERMWKVMRFSSVPLARSLGISAKLPFLHPAVREFASRLDAKSLVGWYHGEMFGKCILRVAFQRDLPVEVAWRTKTPIEFGSGTTILPQYYNKVVDGDFFRSKRAEFEQLDHVKIRDKEHLVYYRIYRELFGPPRPEDPKKRTCPDCTSNVSETTNFCTACGAYPI